MNRRVRLDDEPQPKRRVRLEAPPAQHANKAWSPGLSEPHSTPYPEFEGDAPRQCLMCEKIYWRPCDGKQNDCPNRLFVEVERRNKKEGRK